MIVNCLISTNIWKDSKATKYRQALQFNVLCIELFLQKIIIDTWINQIVHVKTKY